MPPGLTVPGFRQEHYGYALSRSLHPQSPPHYSFRALSGRTVSVHAEFTPVASLRTLSTLTVLSKVPKKFRLASRRSKCQSLDQLARSFSPTESWASRSEEH